jgi:anaphase-promoting complex subunit 6
MFIGMQYLLLSNIKAAHEYLDASYAICQTDPLILNEMGVVNYYMEE